ncbi:helix-turn-helix domain-containing protein [Alkanindiges sp. WGS2144]|uniref:helix-turn-helix domain-containing protein n=1 Tax=Alkanindiges sp. WGS2144 TaxID=3366808 RepID=UPI00375147F9
MEINSNQQPSSSASTGHLTNAQRPGEYLRQLRLTQQRELSEVARELNMPERQLNALEADDYKSLPEPAFIKGYLRAYAKLLGTRADSLIQRFDEIYTSDTGLPSNHALENSPLKALGRLQSSRRGRFGWLKWLLLGLIVLAILWALVAGVRSLRSTPAQATDETAPVSQVNAEPTVLALPSSNVSTQDQLNLSFSRPVNISIKDSTGKTLASGRQEQPLGLSGESPFSIRLDDATAVSLSFNQEQISLTPYTVNGKAEFRLSR